MRLPFQIIIEIAISFFGSFEIYNYTENVFNSQAKKLTTKKYSITDSIVNELHMSL